jgi:hypothetical protein
MTKQQTEDVQVDSQPQQTAEAAPSLTLQDLILVAQIIQLTTQRGAYRAEELENVGALYNKLIAFLDSAGAISKPENANTENQND